MFMNIMGPIPIHVLVLHKADVCKDKFKKKIYIYICYKVAHGQVTNVLCGPSTPFQLDSCALQQLRLLLFAYLHTIT